MWSDGDAVGDGCVTSLVWGRVLGVWQGGMDSVGGISLGEDVELEPCGSSSADAFELDATGAETSTQGVLKDFDPFGGDKVTTG